MSYEPWPEKGCTLAAARERTADRELWAEWRHRDRGRKGSDTDCDELEKKINAAFIALLQEQRLIAYGRRNDPSSAPRVIGSRFWSTLKPDWQNSTAHDGRPGGTVFHAVQVFPASKAPCRIDLLTRKPLAEAFRQYVLQDPEVAALAKRAINCAPEYERVFAQGNYSVGGCNEWPLARKQSRASKSSSPIGALAGPRPLPLKDAEDALHDRFNALVDLLRNGELVGQGIGAEDGALVSIPRTVWAHDQYCLDANRGDVLQLNPACEDPPRDRLRRRWLGVLLERPSPEVRLGEGSSTDRATYAAPTSLVAAPTAAPFSPADIVAAGSLGNALYGLVFHHPEIEELRTEALAASERKGWFFEENAGLLSLCYGHDEWFLPIKCGATDPYVTQPDIEAFDGIIGERLREEPPEIRSFYAVIDYHLWRLFEALRQRDVDAFAHTVEGERLRINHAIWSHEDYYILPRTSDIFEARPGEMIKRWVGVVLEPPNSSGSPTTSVALIQSKSAARVQTTIAAETECTSWLAEEMKKNPLKRRGKKAEWWDLAHSKWQDRLSRNSFNAAWNEAMRLSGAYAWKRAGRPRKLGK